MAVRLQDLLASFRRHLRAASKAPQTIELYSQSVRYFSRWLAEHDRPETRSDRRYQFDDILGGPTLATRSVR